MEKSNKASCVGGPKIKPTPKAAILSQRFVQFLHSGSEHTLTAAERKAGKKNWNYGPHKRKVIKTSGKYYQNGKLFDSELIFWGEWEPDSAVTPIVPQPPRDKFIGHDLHHPLLILGKNGKPKAKRYINGQKCQNTDPFVFGGPFHYSCCQQHYGGALSKLAYLDKGSIIVFGTNYRKPSPTIVIDTVLVVGESRPYNTSSIARDLKGFVTNDYLMIMDLNTPAPGFDFRCYHGATPANSVEGMFSFVPCYDAHDPKINIQQIKRATLAAADFAGLSINANNLINESMTQGFKSCAISLPLSKQIWQCIVDAVIRQGFKIGVEFDYR